MSASGLVSDFSLQYLLKHKCLTQSLYYGQNHSRLKLNEEARNIYVRAMYENIGLEFTKLNSNIFLSPHGVKRKDEIVQLIQQKDLADLTAAAERGDIAAKPIVLGYCMNREPCPYGGIDSIAHCGGGDGSSPCAHVMYDQRKIATVIKLSATIEQRLQVAHVGSPLSQSLGAQLRSARNFLDACQV
jgi:hypothetical protein